MSDILTVEDWKALIMAIGRRRGGKGFSDDELEIIGDWALETKVNYAALQCVLDGRINLDVRGDGELLFVGRE